MTNVGLTPFTPSLHFTVDVGTYFRVSGPLRKR
jgi:hypothetical protein